MSPGREMDALIAEKVMGRPLPTEVMYFSGYPPSGPVDLCPFYSTNIAAAWVVRDVIASKLFSIRQAFTAELQRVISKDLDMAKGELLAHSEVILRVKPHHICLAALKAVGINS